MSITKIGTLVKISASKKTHWVMPVYAPKAYQPKQDIRRSTIAGSVIGSLVSLIPKNRISLPWRTRVKRSIPYTIAGAAIGNLVARYHNKKVDAARAQPVTLRIL